jgi:hypothetical protein
MIRDADDDDDDADDFWNEQGQKSRKQIRIFANQMTTTTSWSVRSRGTFGCSIRQVILD